MHGVCDSSRTEIVLGANLCVRRYVGFHSLKTNREKDPSPKRSRAKNFEENIEKDSPHVLFAFAWYEGLHCIRPEIVVQLVNMEKDFVWFPTIACLSKTCPTGSEFHSGALASVAPVAVDRFYHNFLLVMIGDFQRYCPRWVIVERSHIMYMVTCPFAIDKVFNNVDGLCLLHDLVGTSVPRKELITFANRRCEEHVRVHWIFRDRRVVLHERMEI